jgi:nucleoside-diphosphate-sugar epimerase
MGRPEDACSLPSFCKQFLELAGYQHRVREVEGEAATDEVGSMAKMVRPSYPDPPHDCTRTSAKLGHIPTSLRDGLQQTLDWLKRNQRLPAVSG